MHNFWTATVPLLLLSFGCKSAFAQEQMHPRLLFGPSAISSLRERVDTEPFASIAKAIESELQREAQNREDKTELPDADLTYNFIPRNASWMYLFTGERKYAQLAEVQSLALVRDTVYWNNPTSKGLNRAMQTATVALAYDTCFHEWSAETRALISQKLLAAANGLIASMGEGANNQIGNNWQAVRYGAAGLAALACDETGRLDVAKHAYASLKRHLNFNLGENGWNPEGIGYTAYPWQFTGPFGIAAARNGLGDFRTEMGKKVSMTLWTTLLGTVSIPRINGLGLRADLTDDSPTYNGEGTLGLAFWSAPPEYLPAVKWMHDYLTTGSKQERYFDLDRGGGIYSFLFYPADVAARNPAEIASLNYTDASHGIAVFRNAYQDENDIVAVVNGHSRQPDGAHGGPDTNTFRIMGLGSIWTTGSGRTGDANGQTNLFPGTPETKPIGGLGKLDEIEFLPDGGGRSVTTGSSMGVANHRRVFVADYSKTSGALALFLDAESGDNARLWRLNTPEFNTIKTEGNRFIITAPNGASLVATVLEPQRVPFRTGTFERGSGGDGRDTGFPYRGKLYKQNKWIEFDCEGRVFVVMTLQHGIPPALKFKNGLQGIDATVGNQSVAYDRDVGEILIGAKALEEKIAERKTPLRVRRLVAKVLSDREVQLSWLPDKWGATSLRIERRADGEWNEIGQTSPDAKTFLDS
jgi:hypothetical protein